MAPESPDTRPRMLYENLDTSFVNLWDLLRFLSQRGFVGRVHVELKDYTADVFVNGASSPLVREVDLSASTDTLERAGLHRLVLRARESSGTINVFEGADEAVPPVIAERAEPVANTETFTAVSTPEDEQMVIEVASSEPVETPLSEAPTLLFMNDEPKTEAVVTLVAVAENGENNRDEMGVVSGALIRAVDHALAGIGVEFEGLFRAARLELADDYTFLDPFALDPSTGQFGFLGSQVLVPEDLPPSDFAAGVSEALRRVVETVATGERARRVRERVALDLAAVARKQDSALARSGFRDHLDRIAGTRVI